MNISEKQNDIIEYLKMIIQNANVECPTEKEFIEDWGINGSETLAQLQEFASDYISCAKIKIVGDMRSKNLLFYCLKFKLL